MTNASAATRTYIIPHAMNVPLLDLQAQYESLRDGVQQAVERVLASQRFVLGDEVRQLESTIADYCQTKHAVGCASGSDALLLALMALDVKAGDEVITTPFSFFATAAAITRLGARPVFVDIDPRSYNIDTSRVADAITSRTKVIMPVHIYGQCAHMDPLLDLGKRRGIAVVEDAAQAIGATDKDRRAGSMGLIGCFSFYPTKNLGGAGDGGILTTSDDQIAQRLRRLRTHGGANEYEHEEVGINSRLDELQAAVLRVKFPSLDKWSEERSWKAEFYSQLLSEADLSFPLVTPQVRSDGRHIFHQYVIRVPGNRDALMEHLKAHNIGSKVYYPIPLHEQQCFADLGYKRGDFPEAEAAARETFALPAYPELTEAQQVYVVQTIKSFKP
ncbi:MAG TPA: DegT/DnrJ/EryC1/StrS family aminotransferase [Pyrinomonadaceae bacterium]|nr:DegT/DnrJ/EryC1/StrS family aminotransferase [Pyrinomonadaceae bacterium]